MKTKEQVIKARDEKIIPHLEQYAPVWLVEETYIPEDQSIRFHAVFQHKLYSWVKRRYLYDGFNDVLYHKGQVLMNEDDAWDVMEKEPFINVVVNDIPNSYGG